MKKIVYRKLRDGKRKGYSVNLEGKQELLKVLSYELPENKWSSISEIKEKIPESNLTYSCFYNRLRRLIGWVKIKKIKGKLYVSKNERLTPSNIKKYFETRQQYRELKNQPREIIKEIPIEKRFTRTEDIVRW